MNNENLNITNDNNEENITNPFNFQKKQKKTVSEQKEFDAQLIKSYMGKNHKKIITKNVSLPSLLFGPVYLIYRKLYIGIPLYFIFSLLVFVFTKNLVASIIVFVIQFILNIVIAIKFKKIYMDRAYDDCMKIQEKYNIRPDSEIIELCQEQGGKSFFIVFIIVVALSTVSYALSHSLQMIFNIKEPKQENYTEEYNSNQYDNKNNQNVIDENDLQVENPTNNDVNVSTNDINNNEIGNTNNEDINMNDYITNNQ